jgi:hypothetical protein
MQTTGVSYSFFSLIIPIRTFKVCSSHLPLTISDWRTTKVEQGDRIAQIILERIYTPEVQEVDVSTGNLYSSGGCCNNNHLHDRTLK